jgi:hypothetical protein
MELLYTLKVREIPSIFLKSISMDPESFEALPEMLVTTEYLRKLSNTLDSLSMEENSEQGKIIYERYGVLKKLMGKNERNKEALMSLSIAFEELLRECPLVFPSIKMILGTFQGQSWGINEGAIKDAFASLQMGGFLLASDNIRVFEKEIILDISSSSNPYFRGKGYTILIEKKDKDIVASVYDGKNIKIGDIINIHYDTVMEVVKKKRLAELQNRVTHRIVQKLKDQTNRSIQWENDSPFYAKSNREIRVDTTYSEYVDLDFSDIQLISSNEVIESILSVEEIVEYLNSHKKEIKRPVQKALDNIRDYDPTDQRYRDIHRYSDEFLEDAEHQKIINTCLFKVEEELSGYFEEDISAKRWGRNPHDFPHYALLAYRNIQVMIKKAFTELLKKNRRPSPFTIEAMMQVFTMTLLNYTKAELNSAKGREKIVKKWNGTITGDIFKDFVSFSDSEESEKKEQESSFPIPVIISKNFNAIKTGNIIRKGRSNIYKIPTQTGTVTATCTEEHVIIIGDIWYLGESLHGSLEQVAFITGSAKFSRLKKGTVFPKLREVGGMLIFSLLTKIVLSQNLLLLEGMLILVL